MATVFSMVAAALTFTIVIPPPADCAVCKPIVIRVGNPTPGGKVIVVPRAGVPRYEVPELVSPNPHQPTPKQPNTSKGER